MDVGEFWDSLFKTLNLLPLYIGCYDKPVLTFMEFKNGHGDLGGPGTLFL